MPIRIPNNLPAREVLESENIFVMTEARAESQQIRPLRIGLLNLMPTKITTETQLSRLLGNTPLQVELFLIQVSSHQPKNTPQEHMIAFYHSFEEIKDAYFDGFIITGAPVEKLPFEQVEYWQELCRIMEWTKTHVHSTLHICWGAQAALYYHYGVQKELLPEKLFGVFRHRVVYKIPFCSGASMMNFGCPIPGIPPSAGRMWRPFPKSRFSPLPRRRGFMPCPPNMGTSCLLPGIRNTTRRR